MPAVRGQPGGHRPRLEWVLEAAAEDVEAPPRWPLQVSTDPSWVTAALWCGNTLFEERVRGILTMVDKQRDSVNVTVTEALTTAWLRTSLRDRGLSTFDPTFLDEADTTLYVLSPSDGTVAPLAVILMEQLIRRQRIKVAQWEEYPRIGMFLDELPNTPLRTILRRSAYRHAQSPGLGEVLQDLGRFSVATKQHLDAHSRGVAGVETPDTPKAC